MAGFLITNHIKYFGTPERTALLCVERYLPTGADEMMVQVWIGKRKIVEITESEYVNWLNQEADI